MSLTNPNTPVSQQDLQDFYHKLLPYMGGSFGLIATGMNSADLYGADEQMIGQWVDGKPLYQKTIQATVPTAQGAPTDVSIGASIDTVVDAKTMFTTGNGGFIQTPVINGALSGSVRLSVYNNSYPTASLQNKFRLEQLSGTIVMGGSSCYVTIRYTKTTDSAVESYGTDTTYSTDEHVVGSWIDGSPVYQKTIYNTNLGSISNSAWTNYATISNCKCIIDSVFMRALADGTPSGVFNDIAASVGTSNNIRVISRTTTLTLDDSKSYLTIRYTKSS